jgi:tetratricopeptide (TPR) repeat protein
LDKVTFDDRSPAHDFLSAAVDAELQRSLSGIAGLRLAPSSPPGESHADIELQGTLSDRDNVLTLSVSATDKRQRTNSGRAFEFTLSRPLVRWYELATAAGATIATQLHLTVPEMTVRSAPTPVDGEARSLYTEGRYLWLRNTARDLDGARRALRDSISIDPTFAPAWAALSRVYANQADSHLVDQDVAYQDARVAAIRAIALDPNLAAAHVALAHVYWGADWDWAGAEREVREALRLNPRSAETLHIAGDLAKTLGRWDDAIELFGRARDLDPLQPSASAVAGPLACAGRVEEAEQEWRRVARLDPGVGGAHYGLARLYVAMGRPAEALEALKAEPEETWRRIMVPTVLYTAGRRREADKALADLERRATQDSAEVYIAEAYVAAGDRNAAVHWLQRAFDSHDSNLSFVKADPLLAQVSDDSRYRHILAAMHLPLDGQCVIRRSDRGR